MRIDADIPGGNIVVDEIAGDTVRVHQDLRDTERDWFYWYFRVRDVGAGPLRVEFTRSHAIGARGPGVSVDEGVSWSWLGSSSVNGNGFVYRVTAPMPEVRFSFAMPYTASRWQSFAGGLQGLPGVRRQTLCTTRAGRRSEVLLLGALGATAPRRLAIACRTHCCEMMASYALEGLVDWIARGADEAAAWLRHETQVLVVPFVDLDGVEAGDQGKGRHPRDHGRDYSGDSLYPTTAALRRLLPEFGAGRLEVCLDLHCPWISGPGNEVIFLPGSSDGRVAHEQRRFSALLERHATGPLPVRADDFLPFGTSWNTGANHTEGLGLSGWAAGLPGVRLATGVELPYANAGDAAVDQASARRFGVDLGQALAAYLRDA